MCGHLPVFSCSSGVVCHPSLPTCAPARARVSVYLKVIGEQFIKLMGSAEPDKRPAASGGFNIQPEFLLWLDSRLCQRFSVTLQPL